MPTDAPTVVLVDDAPDVRALVRTHLRLSGRLVVVGEGASGLDAVSLAERHRPALMLLDVSMPVMDGLQALPRVLAVSPDTRVVLFSGFDERGLAARGRALGAAGFIEKSVAVDRLADDLLALLADRPADAPDTDRTGQGAQARAHDRDRTQDQDQNQDQDVLGEDLERFREVFEEAAIGMATLTLTGYVVRANRALVAAIGVPPDALVGAEYAGLAAGDAAPDVRRVVADLTAGRAEIAEVEHPAGADLARRIAATLTVVRGRHGRPLYLFVQARDVTAQRTADERLRQSEERFRLLVEAVEDYAIFMLDPGGHVASWNAGAERIKGYRAEEVVGAHFSVFYPPDARLERHPQRVLRLALRDGHYQEEGWRIRKDGSAFWADVVVTPVRTSAGELVGFA